MRTNSTRRSAMLAGLLLAVGCTVDNDAAQDLPPDAGGGGSAAAAPQAGASGEPGAGGTDTGRGGGGGSATGPDAGTGDAGPAADATPSTSDAADEPCVEACRRFSDCALSECEGLVDADAAGLRDDCGGVCIGNPAFATVVTGSATCADVVEFGRSQAENTGALVDFLAACAPAVEPPPPPDGSECRFACTETEVCLEGHCVRPDGTCAGDIHCRTGSERCAEGQCVPAEFVACRGDDDCAGDQFCLTDAANPLAGGSCVFDCAMGAACPFNERCFPEYGDACYYDLCGAGYANGDPFGACRIGGPAGYDGTCYPLAAENGAGVGICLEAGLAAEGELCDLQVEGRDPASQALGCAPGTYCWGDFDDSELPPTEWMQVGACAGLCDPGAPVCSEGRTCVDLGNGDDPATPEDETRAIGICLSVDCDLFPAPDAPGGCGENEACRLVAVSVVRGECGPQGERAGGEPCDTSDDCAGVAFCGQGGGEATVCLSLCDPTSMASVCGDTRTCYAEAGWTVGFCIDTPAP